MFYACQKDWKRRENKSLSSVFILIRDQLILIYYQNKRLYSLQIMLTKFRKFIPIIKGIPANYH